MTQIELSNLVVLEKTVRGRSHRPDFIGTALLAALFVLLTACSGAPTAPAPQVFDAKASAAALQAAGWKAQEAPGMPDTLSKFKQTGYLESTASDGQQIDMQFMEDAPKAGAELAAVLKQSPSFKGATIGNIMVFSHPTGDATLSAADLGALRNLLK